jgi:hypothetical protein
MRLSHLVSWGIIHTDRNISFPDVWVSILFSTIILQCLIPFLLISNSVSFPISYRTHFHCSFVFLHIQLFLLFPTHKLSSLSQRFSSLEYEITSRFIGQFFLFYSCTISRVILSLPFQFYPSFLTCLGLLSFLISSGVWNNLKIQLQ